jgi:two-component system, OmpR family, sensor histidine kinase KdpD
METAQRRTPEEFLRAVQADEGTAHRGHLKIFLGYASGVGKTFRMLDEARRRRERGQDVVVGAVQPQVPSDAQRLLQQLEVIPLKSVGSGAVIDVEAIRRRSPAICIIDGLAYDNPPGLRNATRWQDVLDLVSSGIKVVGSVNIQYIAELREQVEAITGKLVTQTVPLSFVKSAGEVEVVDAPAPLESTPDRERRKQQLSRLRELTLVLVADLVDHQLTDYLECHGIGQGFGTHERILVCMTPRANVAEMMQVASAIAERFHAEVVAAYVNQPAISAADRALLDQKLALVRKAGARIEILNGDDPAATLLEFARSQRITQLFIGHTQRTGLWPRLRGSPVDRLIRLSRGMDVRVFPQ